MPRGVTPMAVWSYGTDIGNASRTKMQSAQKWYDIRGRRKETLREGVNNAAK